MYIVSRNPKHDKYYLTTRQYFDHLVDRLYDSKKYGSVLVKCANRDAPSLLGYKPTYSGFALRKDKSKMVRKALDLSTVAGQALQRQYLAQDLSTSNLPVRQEQPEQVQTEQQEQEDQPPVTSTQPPRSSRRRGIHSAGEREDQGARKKSRVAEDDVAFIGADGAVDGDTMEPVEPQEIFAPSFKCPDGHVITAGNSLSVNPLLAMTLLKRVALPKDMEGLHTGKANNMAELCLFLVKAGQCASRAFTDMDVFLETKRSQRADLQAQRKEMEKALDKVEALEAKVANAATVKEERDRLLLEVQSLTAEWDQLKDEKKRSEEELSKLLEDAGDAGFNEAGEDYKKQVEDLVGLDYAEVPKDDHRREPPVVPPVDLPGPLPQAEQPNPITSTPPNPVDFAITSPNPVDNSVEA
ncbi:hypothetical protein RHMOL_Rhmol04G0252600 [Rhododendron molle]|uniref:Uncharacterized protein n=1 Tax=Rhododendron molle TaxID=49168 RepID=A0ACC0P423_RHOML|nr:hypothetical protein RHMOL_Rhmol04G0252600 [Rhododendron molle]